MDMFWKELRPDTLRLVCQISCQIAGSALQTGRGTPAAGGWRRRRRWHSRGRRREDRLSVAYRRSSADRRQIGDELLRSGCLFFPAAAPPNKPGDLGAARAPLCSDPVGWLSGGLSVPSGRAGVRAVIPRLSVG